MGTSGSSTPSVIKVTDDYVEIENFLSDDVHEKLLNYLTRPQFPWCLSLDSVGVGPWNHNPNANPVTALKDNSAVGFYHTFVFNGEICSDHANAVGWVMNGFEQATNGQVLIDSMHRIRGGLFTKHPDPTPHLPHVDAPFPDYWSAVYYVNDCDGDLYMYDQTYPEVKLEDVETTNFTVKKRCKVGQNKLIAFDGKYYHSSSFPTEKPYRMAITFNFFRKR